jgi:hypothetical protein
MSDHRKEALVRYVKTLPRVESHEVFSQGPDIMIHAIHEHADACAAPDRCHCPTTFRAEPINRSGATSH